MTNFVAPAPIKDKQRTLPNISSQIQDPSICKGKEANSIVVWSEIKMDRTISGNNIKKELTQKTPAPDRKEISHPHFLASLGSFLPISGIPFKKLFMWGDINASVIYVNVPQAHDIAEANAAPLISNLGNPKFPKISA